MATQNHVLGSGKLFFGRFTAGTLVLAGGMRYLGNSPDLSLTASSTSLDHIDADNGIRVKDDSVILTLDRSLTLTLDDISDANLALFVSADTSKVSQASVTAPNGTYAIDGVNPDDYVQIGETANNPSGVRSLVTVVVKNDAGSPVTYVLGTDYTVDLETGLLHVLDTGAITTGTNLRITYGLTAKTINRIQTSALSTVTGRLLFVSQNARGLQRDFLFPYVQLSPNGDTPLKGETWQTLPLKGDILQLNAATPHILMNGRAYTP